MQQPYGRVLGIAALILFAVSGIIYSKFGYSMLFPSDGPYVNHNGDITGGDFLVFYNAAVMTLKGAAQSIWDHPVFEAQLQQIYGQEILMLHFFNPPPALMLWTPFGLLSHNYALWLWTALPLIALGVCIYRLTGNWLSTALVLISPLTAYSAGAGQTGALFAVLMAAFLLSYQQHPIRAGGIAALVTIKPHLAFAMPVCFLVDRNWRALAAMIVCTLAVCIAVTAMLGLQVWVAFIDGVRHHSGEFFSATNPTFDRSPSMLLLLLRLGASETLAWSAQVFISLASLAMLVVIWRTAEDPLHRAFGLALAICLLNPKVLHYDAAVLLIPIAMLIARLERGTVELSYLLLAIFVWCLPYWEPAFKAIGAHPGALVLFAGMILTTVKSLPAQAAPHVVSAPDQTAP